jgi:hypothetical protein
MKRKLEDGWFVFLYKNGFEKTEYWNKKSIYGTEAHRFNTIKPVGEIRRKTVENIYVINRKNIE